MRNIEDLEHFVLAEGETLILRPKHALSDEEMAHMRATIERFLPGKPVLCIAPDVEVLAGRLEVWGADTGPVDDAAVTEALRRAAVEKAYSDGRTIWARDGVEIYQVQLIANPLPSFRWDEPWCAYGLTRKDVCD